MKILSCAINLTKSYDDVIFLTNDLALKHIALLFFDKVYSIGDEVDTYCGYQEIVFDDNETMAEFYSNLDKNICNLLPNEYLIIKDEEDKVVDRLCWTGEFHRPLKFSNFSSKWFDVKPLKGDVY